MSWHSFLARCWPLLLACAPCRAADEEERGCVWRLEGAGAVVYLAGSIHLLRESDHPLPPAYEAAYADCARVCFEIDLQSAKSAEGQAAVAKLGMLPAGEGLDRWLTPETMGDLRAYLGRRSLPKAQMERLRPGMLSLTISQVEAMRMGALPQFGVEALFDGKARRDGKPVEALETLEFQLGLFNEMSQEAQDRMLRITLDQVDEAAETLDSMIQAWRQGDGPKLAEELNRNFEPQDADLLKRLLHDRNADWIPAIERALQRPAGENTLILVGAGHLVGKKSVIELLEEKGYQPVPWGPAAK